MRRMSYSQIAHAFAVRTGIWEIPEISGAVKGCANFCMCIDTLLQILAPGPPTQMLVQTAYVPGAHTPFNELPHPIRDRLLDMYERDIENNGQELLKASSILHMHPETLKRRLREWRQNAETVKAVETVIPYSSSRIYTDYFRVVGDDWLLISNIEFPDHHAQTLRYALLTARAHNIKKLAILGDVLATDQEALNHWPAAWMPDPEQPYHMVVRFLKRILRDLTEWFPEGVWIISGNHDERLPKATSGNLDLGLLIEDIPGVHFSNYRYMWIDTSRGPIYACHQQNFGRNLLTAY
jgi:hypothetical protein